MSFVTNSIASVIVTVSHLREATPLSAFSYTCDIIKLK